MDKTPSAASRSAICSAVVLYTAICQFPSFSIMESIAESSIEFNSVKIVHTMRTDNTIPISVISVRPLFFRKLLVASLIQTPIVIPPRAYRP